MLQLHLLLICKAKAEFLGSSILWYSVLYPAAFIVCQSSQEEQMLWRIFSHFVLGLGKKGILGLSEEGH